MNISEILFIDLEVSTRTLKIDKVGALIHNSEYKGSSVSAIKELYDKFKPQYICGHNFINQDKTFLLKTTFNPIFDDIKIIDTFDKAYEEINAIIEMPDNKIKSLIAFILQNKNKLSKSKREKYYQKLTDTEVQNIEEIIDECFDF